jgi:hypothetical protein
MFTMTLCLFGQLLKGQSLSILLGHLCITASQAGIMFVLWSACLWSAFGARQSLRGSKTNSPGLCGQLLNGQEVNIIQGHQIICCASVRCYVCFVVSFLQACLRHVCKLSNFKQARIEQLCFT